MVDERCSEGGATGHDSYAPCLGQTFLTSHGIGRFFRVREPLPAGDDPNAAAPHKAHAALEAVNPRLQLALPAVTPVRRLTHYLFRFPAKFHPPVVSALLDRFTVAGDTVLDPFVGSGTLLVEGALAGRRCVGLDVDPVAVAVARAKTRKYDLDAVAAMSERLLEAVSQFDRGADEYARLSRSDISLTEMSSAIRDEQLWVPAIPNLEHWFRRYVVVDLARIHRQIMRRRGDSQTRHLLLILFGSIIRNASNADPVPVSGLEVTAHMLRLEAKGRVVDPFALLRKAIARGVAAIEEWTSALGESDAPSVFEGDATAAVAEIPEQVDAVITSPPYNNAVDYYRRHQLEMFWLGLTLSHQDRLQLLPRYVGRPRIPASHPLLAEPWPKDGLAAEWEREIAQSSPGRATDFKHYMLAMSRAMRRLAERTTEGAPVVMVVGQSGWNGAMIPTVALFHELAGAWFASEPTLWYPVRNRYMSYSRHNGASIDREHVVVLRRTDAPVDGLA